MDSMLQGQKQRTQAPKFSESSSKALSSKFSPKLSTYMRVYTEAYLAPTSGINYNIRLFPATAAFEQKTHHFTQCNHTLPMQPPMHVIQSDYWHCMPNKGLHYHPGIITDQSPNSSGSVRSWFPSSRTVRRFWWFRRYMLGMTTSLLCLRSNHFRLGNSWKKSSGKLLRWFPSRYKY